MSKDKSEPAFPRPLTHVDLNADGMTVFHQNGMSLRDYFAGQVIPMAVKMLKDQSTEFAAAAAYKIADAMLAERAK